MKLEAFVAGYIPRNSERKSTHTQNSGQSPVLTSRMDHLCKPCYCGTQSAFYHHRRDTPASTVMTRVFGKCIDSSEGNRSHQTEGAACLSLCKRWHLLSRISTEVLIARRPFAMLIFCVLLCLPRENFSVLHHNNSIINGNSSYICYNGYTCNRSYSCTCSVQREYSPYYY